MTRTPDGCTMTGDAPEAVGDLGARCARARDVRPEARAVRERWPLDPATRAMILDRLIASVHPSSGAKPRTVLLAVRALLAADRLNRDQRKVELGDRPAPPQGPDLYDYAAAVKEYEADPERRAEEGRDGDGDAGRPAPGGGGVPGQPGRFRSDVLGRDADDGHGRDLLKVAC